MKNLLKNLRNQLHQNPEIAFYENETQKILISFLTKNIINKKKFEILTPFKTSILVKFQNNNKEPFLLFRADMDALPIQEPSTNPIVSKKKWSYACVWTRYSYDYFKWTHFRN